MNPHQRARENAEIEAKTVGWDTQWSVYREMLSASSVIAAIVINFMVAACSHERATVSNLEATPDNPGNSYSYSLGVQGALLGVQGALVGAAIAVLCHRESQKQVTEETPLKEKACIDIPSIGGVGQSLRHSDMIPSNAASYSLFLICNPEWISKLDDDLNAFNPLYRNYRAFGEAIGQKHLAIWFWEVVKAKGRLQEQAVNILRYDVDRAVGYCSKYKLKPSRSPYILVTTSYPDSESSLENYLTVELGDLDERGSLKMLSALADQILTENLNQEQLDSAKYWISWRSILDRVMISLGSLSEKVHVSLDTKFIKIGFGQPDESDGAQAAPSKK